MSTLALSMGRVCVRVHVVPLALLQAVPFLGALHCVVSTLVDGRRTLRQLAEKQA
jgi:hypothetical protein